MPKFRRIVFKIDDRKPQELPAARLAEYIAKVASLLGNRDKVHMVGINDQSTDLVHLVDEECFQEVYARARLVCDPAAPKDVKRVGRELNQLLRGDTTAGRFIDDGDKQISELPGATKPAPITYGPFKQRGSVQGELQRVGGSGDTIPVWLYDDNQEPIHCMTKSRALAKELAAHMYEQIRLEGIGKWKREEEDDWELDEFEVQGYEQLSDEPLLSVVSRLRAIEGSEWAEMADPLAELHRIRHGNNEAD